MWSEPRMMGHVGLAATSNRPRPHGSPEIKRAAMFRESLFERCERYVLGLAWALSPKRIHMAAQAARLHLADLFGRGRTLPDVSSMAPHQSIAGIARDLSPATLMSAYAGGLFPHGHIGPPKWHSPTERAVLKLDAFHSSRRLRSIMRQGRYRVTFDQAFEDVVKSCAGRRAGRWHLTWITPRIMRAYAQLYDQGHAHSFEVWNAQGELVGGGYGVAVGPVFVIESQFFRESNASKVGFSVLVWHLAKWGFTLCDNKWLTATTAQMGFRDVPRSDYLGYLAAAGNRTLRPGHWDAEADTKTVADWHPAKPKAAGA